MDATYLCMGDLATLLGSSLGHLGVTVSQIADADTGSHVEQLDTLVSGDPAAFTILKDVLRETADTLGDVGLAKSGGVKASCWHSWMESLGPLGGGGEVTMR